ncbi:MAG TPA: hypothetical protein VG184_05010 [Acidimicrobiales bacterium]|jgi:hypothetical protein|nr:hypothetical protein [Acidimicrobiales bacterium]
MAFRSRSLTAVLLAWPATVGVSPPARRAARGWAGDPVLAGFATPGAAALAVSSDDPTAGVVLAALMARPGEDWAATAAVAGLAARLARIVGRWARSGLSGGALEVAEADLVAATVEVLATVRPAPAPAVVVQAAWHRVYGVRRTEAARAARRVPLDDDRLVGGRPARSTAEEVLAVLAGAARCGTVSVSQARALGAWVAGWPTATAAQRAGVSIEVLRARRHRGVRALAAAGAGGVVRCCRSGWSAPAG